jgi:purine-binding chemotaxis protein CheW
LHVPVVPPPESPLPAIAPAARVEPPDLLAEVAALLDAGDALEAITPRGASARARRRGGVHAPGRGHANLARWRHAREACEHALALDTLQLHAHFVLGMVLDTAATPMARWSRSSACCISTRARWRTWPWPAYARARAARTPRAARCATSCACWPSCRRAPPCPARADDGWRLMAVAQELGGIVPEDARMSEQDRVDWALAYRRVAAADRALDEADHPSATRLDAIWQARAQALAAPLAVQDDEREARLPVAVFLLAGERYAVDVTRVLAIQPLEDLTLVPHTPPHIAGVAIVRGRVLTVLDLRALFDLPRQGLTENSRVLVVQGAGIEAGLLADECWQSRTSGRRAEAPLYPGGHARRLSARRRRT